MPSNPEFSQFVETIARLRAPDGCPWDREQTHESIARNMLEEAYEAVDAIESGDIEHLREELGDVLLEVVLQSQIAADAGEFTIDDVCRDINAKMIRRHPHIFGDSEADTPDEVLTQWESIKRDEKDADQSFLGDVPKSLPALMYAQKISKKVVGVGFEWETIADVWRQVFSEIDELKTAYADVEKDEKGRVPVGSEVELEVGDVLFTFVNLARKMGIDAETALRKSSEKFKKRWQFIESAAKEQGRPIDDLSIDEMNELWDKAKLGEN
jgi:tetrapyrrole methylase family protein/MazG family protein